MLLINKTQEEEQYQQVNVSVWWCGQEVGSVHQCPSCNVNVHPFCGSTVGEEGFGQPVLCPSCDQVISNEAVISASPLVAAFQRALPVACATSVSVLPSSDESDSAGPADTPMSVECSPSVSKKRATQSVSTVHRRRMVLRWMIERESVDGIKGLMARGADNFPSRREFIRSAPRGSVSVSRRSSQGRTRVAVKVIGGRGRPRSEWVTWLYPRLLGEFDRLRKLGLKLDAPLLRQVALRVLKLSDGEYNAKTADKGGALIVDKITARWIQTFMDNHGIVLRAQTVKRQLSPEKQLQIDRSVVRHLGELQRGFLSGRLNESTVENTDETHFVTDYDNAKTLGFAGEKQVKYADVVSGGEGITMVVRITGGPSGRIMPSMMIFTNAEGSYEIRGVNDDVPGVCYRTGKKSWMTKRVFREYLTEKRAMNPDRLGREKTIFLDNCSGRLEESECKAELAALNAKIRCLPPNAIDLCQPADSFVIAKIKGVWSRKWNEKKIDLIDNHEWQNQPRKDGSWSGKLKNPGKRFFLQLAADVIKEVNAKRDKNGQNYARKAMIRCGMSLGLDGRWSTAQLFPHLQELIKKHPLDFVGGREDKVAMVTPNQDGGQEAIV